MEPSAPSEGQGSRRGIETGVGGERAIAALLDRLMRELLGTAGIEREMVATSRRSVAAVQEDQQDVARVELRGARHEFDLFRASLLDAHARSGGDGSREVAYDARDATRNAEADALIQFVVRPGYAEVRTEEMAPGEYVYYLRVDWTRLRDLAAETGHPIEF